MERLTSKMESGGYCTTKPFDSIQEEVNALRIKLGKYEDTGLEPEDIGAAIEDCPVDFIEEAEKFKIPPEIEVKIPSYFIAAFTGELVSVFGGYIIERDKYDDYTLLWVTSTGGWNDAMRMTCRKLNVQWLYDYYNSLEWFDSDIFDGIIAERVCEFLNGERGSTSEYCKYIKESEKQNEDQN